MAPADTIWRRILGHRAVAEAVPESGVKNFVTYFPKGRPLEIVTPILGVIKTHPPGVIGHRLRGSRVTPKSGDEHANQKHVSCDPRVGA